MVKSLLPEPIPLDGANPHNFKLLGRSPGYKPGSYDTWLDYTFQDYIKCVKAQYCSLWQSGQDG